MSQLSDTSLGTLQQTRDHNKANELEKIDDVSTHLAHDARGNMTFGARPGAEADAAKAQHLVYDAWNRLVEV